VSPFGFSARRLFNVFIVFIEREPTSGWRNPTRWVELEAVGDRRWDQGWVWPRAGAGTSVSVLRSTPRVRGARGGNPPVTERRWHHPWLEGNPREITGRVTSRYLPAEKRWTLWVGFRDGSRTQIRGVPGGFGVAVVPGPSLPKRSRSCLCMVNKNSLVQNPVGGFFSSEEP